MVVEYKAESLQPAKYSGKNIMVEQVTTCPICKKSISPVHLNSVFRIVDETAYVESHLLCEGCYHSFIASYRCRISNSGYPQQGKLVSTEPNKYEKHIFDANIIKLSPQFDKIYN